MNTSSVMLPIGKLAPFYLSRLLEQYTSQDETIIVGPQVGVDATVIDQGDHYLIAKTDPITFVSDNIGYYAVHINANDIACMGGTPHWFLATLLLPVNLTTPDLVTLIFSQLRGACDELHIMFCGGHTEITHGINRPIIVGQMLGTVAKNSLIQPQHIKVGDDILLTKGIAIEATSIIAREKARALRQIYSEELVAKCQNYLFDPGISVVREALLAVQTGGVHAMHDPTEGGLVTGLRELAQAAQVGLKIIEDDIPILPESKLLCDQFGIDPLGAIASGALLIVVEPSATHRILEAFHQQQLTIKTIGKIMPVDDGLVMVSNGQKSFLPEFQQDEITKLFH
ncbi:MAG: AIR synthase family protein [candidate division KSB1 bacterium]|nr:AIR synthase family protein [candidate division KSB1 bacterium]MDZ7341911.1 AIR synthase family protein [candidate division KSB1 bacterium]